MDRKSAPVSNKGPSANPQSPRVPVAVSPPIPGTRVGINTSAGAGVAVGVGTGVAVGVGLGAAVAVGVAGAAVGGALTHPIKTSKPNRAKIGKGNRINLLNLLNPCGGFSCLPDGKV